MANKGLINIFNNGKQEAFFPKSIYESVYTDSTLSVTLKEEITGLQSFKTIAGEKLSTIETGANNYVHPATSGNKHIPTGGKTGQILKWSADGTAVWGEDQNTTYGVATGSSNGLMSSADKTKLDGIATGANNYVHPTGAGNNHIPAGGSAGQVLRWSTAGVAVWGADNDTTYTVVTTTANGLMSSADKTKLDGIAEGANRYIHPDNANTRHVTDTEKSTWNAKETPTGAQSKADTALAQAKVYADNKVASVVDSAPEALDTLKELSAALGNDPNFATTIATQIGGKVDKVTGKGLSTNDYSNVEKSKLAGIADNANNYVHPTTTGNKHIPSGGASGQILRWSASGTAIWGEETTITYGVVSKQGPGLAPQLPDEMTTTKYLRQDGTWAVPPNTTYGVATGSSNGLMSSADKTKLDGVATGANNYVHPATSGNKHIPSGGSSGQYLAYSTDGTAAWTTLPSASTTVTGLVQLNDATNSTSTTQAATANAVKKAYDLANGKASTSVATTSANGLMSAADKTKLDGATNANTASKIVMRDSAGNFSAGTITATLSGNASTATRLATSRTIQVSGDVTGSASFNGSANADISVKVKNISRTDLSGQTVDVNTYTLSTGSPSSQHYKELTTGGAEKITNIPVSEPFLLDVELIRWASASDYITKQTFTSVTTKSTYERFCTNGVWTSWLPTARFTAVPTSGQVVVSDGTAGGIKTTGFTIAKSVPSNAVFTDTVYTHPSTSGNRHIPSGGSAGQILRWSADGVAIWGADNNTTYGVVSKSAPGLAPQLPNETTTTKYLRQDGSWSVPPNTTYGVASGSSNGLMSAADKKSVDALVTENNQLKQILVILANLNGSSLTSSSSMTQILAAFTELASQTTDMQFVYGSLEAVSSVEEI